MGIAESADTYGIDHWSFLWSRYRKLARVKFESKIIEFCSDTLNNWAIRPWVQLVVRANFLQLFQFHRLFNVKFNFGHCLRQSPRLFLSKPFWGNHISVAKWADPNGFPHWRILLSSYRKLAQLEFEPSTIEFRSHVPTDGAIRPRVQLTLRANFVQLLQLNRLLSAIFHFSHCLRQSPRLLGSKFYWGNHMNVAEWADTYGIRHWRILWSCYRKLARVGF